MLKNKLVILMVCLASQISLGAIIVSQLGDEDGFGSYQSPVNSFYQSSVDGSYQSSVDDMTRSEMIETLLYKNRGIVEMDVYADNTDKGWTHYFSIPEGHTIVSANLRIGFVESGERHWNVHELREIYRVDYLSVILDSYLPGGAGVAPSVMISQQPGYVRPAPMTTIEFNLDLDNILFNQGWGDYTNPTFNGSEISSLYNGEFNIWGLADAGVDYSILTIETAPEPATMLLFIFGGILLRKKRNET